MQKYSSPDAEDQTLRWVIQNPVNQKLQELADRGERDRDPRPVPSPDLPIFSY
jgi:hypothetical protein